MRNPVLSVATIPSAEESRASLRVAIRQLERAEIYVAAVAAMELEDRDACRALLRLRSDIDALRHHLIDVRSQT